MSLPTIHRVVTRHDEKKGMAIVSSQRPLPTVVEIAAVPGMVFHEVWTTAGTPAAIDNGTDPTLVPLRLLPPKSGTRVRFVDFPPETPDVLVRGSEKPEDSFAQIGDLAAFAVFALKEACVQTPAHNTHCHHRPIRHGLTQSAGNKGA